MKRLMLVWVMILCLLPLGVWAEDETAQTLYPIRENGLWGYMNRAGEVVIEPQWAKLSPWYGDYAAATPDGQHWGIIDRSGEAILPFEYQIDWEDTCRVMSVYAFGFSRARNLEEPTYPVCGVFDTRSGTFSGLQWRSVELAWRMEHEDSLLPVKGMNGQWGYVNASTGQEAIACQFADADYFQEGWAGITYEKPLPDNDWCFDALINAEGKLLHAPEGMAIGGLNGVSGGWIDVMEKQTLLMGYMDTRGQIVLPPQIDGEVSGFYGNFAVVSYLDSENNPEAYYMDRSGQRLPGVYPCSPGDLGYGFHNGIVSVYVQSKEDDLWHEAAMDEDGGILFILDDPEAYLMPFFDADRTWYGSYNSDSGDASEVYAYNEPDTLLFQHGLIDRNGTVLSDLCFHCLGEYGSPFCEGVAAVSLDGLWGYINDAAAWVIPPQYDSAASFSDGLALVEQDGRLLYITHDGTVVWEEE